MQKDEKSKRHLVETHLFFKDNFNLLLRKSNLLVIKPILGPQIIEVRQRGGLYEVITCESQGNFTTSDELYNHLTKKLLVKRPYIIQLLPQSIPLTQHSYFTVQRKSTSSYWQIANCSTIEDGLFKKMNNKFQQWKLTDVLLSIAEKLGIAFPTCHTIVIEMIIMNGQFWCVDTILHDRNSKWSQYNSLSIKKSLRSFVPKTELCTHQNLERFLKKYRQVILKPCIGQQGKGIIKISVTSLTSFEIYERNKRNVILTYEELYKYIERTYLTQKYYIIQQFIPLETINNCPYDIRVITQKDKEQWYVTGMLVKLAATDYFITNRAQQLLTLEKVLRNTTSDWKSKRKKQAIEELCKRASSILEESVEGISIIGFDIGMDVYGKLWMIEANYVPALAMFYGFEDNKAHTTINHFICMNKKSSDK